ncbi:MAG: hypothetical protein ACK4PK_10500 [Alphaproteobacteria bacterium]
MKPSSDADSRSSEKTLEHVLREILWQVEEAKNILLRDREKANIGHIASLLDVSHVYKTLGIQKYEQAPEREDGENLE